MRFIVVLQDFVSFLVLQSSRRGREIWFLYFCFCSEFHVSVYRSLTLPRSAMGWSIEYDCGISWS